MREIKSDIQAVAFWEVGLHAEADENEHSVAASFMVRTSGEVNLVELAVLDMVHGHLVSSPHTYRTADGEGPKTLRDLYAIPVNYELDTPTRMNRPEAAMVNAGCHAPVELRELQIVHIPQQAS